MGVEMISSVSATRLQDNELKTKLQAATTLNDNLPLSQCQELSAYIIRCIDDMHEIRWNFGLFNGNRRQLKFDAEKDLIFQLRSTDSGKSLAGIKDAYRQYVIKVGEKCTVSGNTARFMAVMGENLGIEPIITGKDIQLYNFARYGATPATASYRGGIKNHQRHGYGLLTFANGESVYGHWNADILDMSKPVTFHYKNGDTYVGSWRPFQHQQYGDQTFVDPQRQNYEEQVQDGSMVGKGVYKRQNGEIYDGKRSKTLTVKSIPGTFERENCYHHDNYWTGTLTNRAGVTVKAEWGFNQKNKLFIYSTEPFTAQEQELVNHTHRDSTSEKISASIPVPDVSEAKVTTAPRQSPTVNSSPQATTPEETTPEYDSIDGVMSETPAAAVVITPLHPLQAKASIKWVMLNQSPGLLKSYINDRQAINIFSVAVCNEFTNRGTDKTFDVSVLKSVYPLRYQMPTDIELNALAAIINQALRQKERIRPPAKADKQKSAAALTPINNAQMKKHGFRIHDVSADGACLYRSAMAVRSKDQGWCQRYPNKKLLEDAEAKAFLDETVRTQVTQGTLQSLEFCPWIIDPLLRICKQSGINFFDLGEHIYQHCYANGNFVLYSPDGIADELLPDDAVISSYEMKEALKSLAEIYGTKLAKSFGIPVITPTTKNIPEILKNNDAVIVWDEQKLHYFVAAKDGYFNGS